MVYSNLFVKVNEQLYFFNGVYWQKDSKTNSRLNLFIGQEYYESFSSLIPSFYKEVYKIKKEDERCRELDKLEKYIQAVGCFVDSKARDRYVKDIVNAITNDDIKFDENPYLFCFNNKVYDLRTHKFITPNPKDYISLTTGYDYIDKLDEDKALEKELEKLISTIFPDEDEKKMYLTILSTALEGLNLEKFVIASGGGGNGKGVLNELACKTLGNYSYILPSTVLLGQQKKVSVVLPQFYL
jgi:phage/plasmid-associated DNA primase